MVRPIVGSAHPHSAVNSSPKQRHFAPCGGRPGSRVGAVKKPRVHSFLSIGSALVAAGAIAQTDPAASAETAWAASAERFAAQAAQAAVGTRPDMRIEIVVGRLDPRLKLAPCQRIDTYLPPGQRAWGRTRVGMRCVEGPVAWNVYLPITVKVFAPALMATQPLAAGTVLQSAHFRLAEADWAESASPALVGAGLAVGRTLARPLAAGSPLRGTDLKKRQWFAAGDAVRVVAGGLGYAVSGEGLALTPGIEGQPARVRTAAGRTLTGTATGDRRVEVAL